MATMMASTGLTAQQTVQPLARAASTARCCPVTAPRSMTVRSRPAGFARSWQPAMHSCHRRIMRLCAAVDKTATADVAAEADAAVDDGSEEVPIEETSDSSRYAELMQRARDAIESGSQDDQDQVLAEIDTELTVSAAKAEAADVQLSAAQGEVDAARDKFLRLNAEFDNYRKRSAKEKSDAVNKAKGGVVSDLLPVIDAFEAAAGQVKAETEGEQRIAASYQGLYAKMVDAFKKMGLEVVPGVGTPFDPEVHEAIMRAPSNDMPDGSVLQEFRRGFKIGGTLLRPAMVQVSYTDDSTAEQADTVTKGAQLSPDAEAPDDASE